MKIFNYEHHKNLFDTIPVKRCTIHYKKYSTNNIVLLNTKKHFFRNSFFSSTVIKWNKLDLTLELLNLTVFWRFQGVEKGCIGNKWVKCFSTFKEILQFIRSSPNSVYNCHQSRRIKFITRLILGLSYLWWHKFKRSFRGLINPLCNYDRDVGSTTHFFFQCPFLINEGIVGGGFLTPLFYEYPPYISYSSFFQILLQMSFLFKNHSFVEVIYLLIRCNKTNVLSVKQIILIEIGLFLLHWQWWTRYRSW